MQGRAFFLLSLSAVVLTYVVVVLGAYVRLSDAGLGCPDWPGCYGRMIVSEQTGVFDGTAIDYGKAWKEMIHRYAAGLLGLMIFLMTVLAWLRRRGAPVGLVTTIAGLVIFQAALGMWTVTWLLKPAVVSAHLLGGMAILALLFWLLLGQLFRFNNTGTDPGLRPWAVAGLLVLVVQIFLGGWTSANYAALICPDFPQCRNGEWLPPLDFSEGFRLWRGLGVNYEGGVLDAAARSAIHISHRIGALITFIVLTAVACRALRSRMTGIKMTGLLLFAVLIVQIGLGIANVVMVLPLPVAVAHNGVAALLLMIIVALLYLSRSRAMLFRPPR
ncbi:MAG: COX15/CtaA family protein [Gammaproteobacteria bacterium]